MITVDYIDHSGNDLMVVNAARVSFAKKHSEFGEDDARLLRYLASHRHWTPFAHPHITVHVTAPIFVRTQCYKHKVGFIENEVSRRYVDGEPEFFRPRTWRGRPVNKKQGSDGFPAVEQDLLSNEYERAIRACQEVYRHLIGSGVAPEQARMILPQSMMTEWYWTGSLAAYYRFCNLRLSEDAQKETQIVATLVSALVHELFPNSWQALMCEG